MKNLKTLRILLPIILIILWILFTFFSPIEDFERGYFGAFLDALFGSEDDIGMFMRIVRGLPFASLLALSLLYILNLKQQFDITTNQVKKVAMAAFVINLIYSLSILLMDGALTALMHYSRKTANSQGAEIDESVVDEIALMFYWFNILVPVLFLAFMFIHRKVVKLENESLESTF